MKRFRLIFLAIAGIMLVSPLIAQIKPSLHFTEDDGLAGTLIRDLVKDRDGLLWIATENGISVFDGNSFTTLDQSNGLPTNLVYALAVDDDNNIYAGCYNGGLAVIKGNSVVKVVHTPGKYPDTYRRLCYSKYFKRIVAGTQNGIFILKDSTMIPVDWSPRVQDQVSRVLSITAEGPRIFFTLQGGDFPGTGLYQLFVNERSPENSHVEKVSFRGRFAALIQDDVLYSATHDSIFRFDPNNLGKGYTSMVLDSTFFIWNMTAAGGGDFWIGGLGDGRFKGGILRYRTRDNSIISLPVKQNLQSVNAVVQDTLSGLTWIGRDNGLTVCFDSPFEIIESNLKENILDLGVKGDTLYALTENSLCTVDHGRLKPILTSKDAMMHLRPFYQSIMVKSKDRYKLLIDSWSSCEFSTFVPNNGMLFINTPMGSISVPDMRTYIPCPNGTFLVNKDGTGYLMPAYSYMRRLDPGSKRNLSAVENEDGQVRNVFKMIESHGTVYMASGLRGIYAIRDGRVSSLNSSNSGLENTITDIDQDAKGNIWCSSATGDLYQVGFDDRLRIIKAISRTELGLNGSNCKWIRFSGHYLLLGTSKGLNVIPLDSLSSLHPHVRFFYNAWNGYDFSSALSPVRTRDGKVYVRTMDKIIAIGTNFHPVPGVQIKIYDATRDYTGKIGDLDGMIFPYSTGQISFLFKAVKFPVSRNLSYRYQVNNEEWINGNMVNLLSLRYGEYVIHMEVFDKESMATSSSMVTFTIRKPLWLEPWFILLFLVLISIMGWLIVRLRIMSVTRIQDERTRLVIENSALQLRALQVLMNPHFIFNALSSLQNLILLKDTRESLSYLGILSRIIRNNLENATKEYITVPEEIEFLRNYSAVEQVRFKNRLNIEINNQTRDVNLMIPPMLVQPMIENAVKHGTQHLNGPGKIQVNFEQVENALLVTVRDNGIGREKNMQLKRENRTGMGLAIVQNRLELLNEINLTNLNRLEISDLTADGQPSGTEVRIYLSLRQVRFSL